MLIFAAVAVGIALAVLLYLRPKRAFTPPVPASPPPSADKQQRPWGTWVPTRLSYPAITPLLDSSLDNVLPIPYRPFKWGPKHVINMGIRPMKWDEWLQLDSDFAKVHAVRLERVRNNDKYLSYCTPVEYRPHALECLLEMCSFLAARYPNMFAVTRCEYDAADPATHGDSIAGEHAGAVNSIRNHLTGESWDFAQLAAEQGPSWDPMQVASLLTEDDVVCMVEDGNGEYRFRAGAACTPGFWRLQDRLNQSLEDLHATGNVPGWREKLKFSMERFFQRLPVDKPVERNNFFFQVDSGLDWSTRTLGPREAFDMRAKGPDPDLVGGSSEPRWEEPGPAARFEEVWFRTERQTLRRMPRTGCVFFTIRTYLINVPELANEPGVPGRFASAVRAWPDNVAAYHGAPLFKDVLLENLDRLHDAQLADGLELDKDGLVVGGPRYPL